MSVKQEFLDQLRADLRKYPSGAVDDYVDYYDELISERVASGEKETAILQHIGSPKEAAASFKQDNAIERAVKRPTVSNGFKALIAVLSVLSLPFLVPILGVLVALLAAGLAVFAAILAALIGGVVAAVLSVIDMASIVLAGDAPAYLLLLVIGVALIVGFVAFELIRGLLFFGRWIVRTLIHKLTARHTKRRQRGQDENAEEQ